MVCQEGPHSECSICADQCCLPFTPSIRQNGLLPTCSLKPTSLNMKHHEPWPVRPERRPSLLLQASGILLAVTLATNAYAFRCDGGLVRMNDTKEEVLAKCGQPSHEHGHKWYYDASSGFRAREVLFVDRKVWRIQTVNPGT